MSNLDYIVRDLQRRMANMIRRGRIHGVDFSQTPPRVQVAYDNDLTTGQPVVSGWLPWVNGRASSASRVDWEPLAVGEQVLILSESGDLSAGVVVPSIADATNAVPEQSPDIHVSRYEDGTTLSYDRAGHILSVDVQGEMTLNVTGNVRLKADGDITADGSTIKLNQGDGVVTGACICPFTGNPHADISTLVFAGK